MTTAIIKCPDRYIDTTIDDEIVLLALDSADFFSLTGTSISIWQLIDGSRTRAEITSAVAAEYGVAASEIESEVAEFIDQLVEGGFARNA
jgi:hypothetical protein